MKIYLEPKGWPSKIEDAPSGLLARVRKGKVILYFKGPTATEFSRIFDMQGNQTTVTGLVQPVELKTEK